MDIVKALDYCRYFISEDCSRSLLGYVHCVNNHYRAGTGTTAIECRIDGVQPDRCIPVAKFLRGAEYEGKPESFSTIFPDKLENEAVRMSFSGIKTIKTWGRVLRLLKGLLKTNKGKGVFLLKANEDGIYVIAANNETTSEGLCYKIQQPVTVHSSKTDFWYVVDNWLTAFKVLEDYKPEVVTISIAENGFIDFFIGEDVRIKFTPMKNPARANPKTVEFAGELLI